MLFLLISILVGIVAYFLTGLFASHRVAVIVGILVGVIFFLSGGLHL